MDAAREQIEFIQPIALLRSGTHEDAVRAVAQASVAAYVTDPMVPSWQPWLSGRFAKTVRRAKAVHFNAAAEQALAVVRVGDAAAAAFAPVTYADMPGYLRKMQVAGTDLPRAGEWGPEGADGPTLLVNDSLGMSTGKAAAQAAHGLFAWALGMPWEWLGEWAEDGYPYIASSADATEFDQRVGNASVKIADAGLTEVEPGSVTVAVFD